MDRKMISKIVKASGISSGEMILIHFWGEDADKEIANNFMAAVAEIGATPLLLQQSRSVNKDIFLAAKESCFGEQYFDLFTAFDAVVDVFTYQPVVLGYEIADDKFELYRKYMAQLFSKFMNCKRFTQIRIPTAANAEESGLNPEDYVQRMERAYNIDYAAVYESCRQTKHRFEGADKVLLRTGTDCELSFELTHRVWHIDAGDGDLPCGEIYIAPVENKTQGTVYFKEFYLDGTKYEHVLLHIKDGHIIHSSLPEITDYFEKQPFENKIVCELGLGMNPNVTQLCGYTALDEKMYGTFHIAVGANNMFGGTNAASEHIDFVGHGTIVISGEQSYE